MKLSLWPDLGQNINISSTWGAGSTATVSPVSPSCNSLTTFYPLMKFDLFLLLSLSEFAANIYPRRVTQPLYNGFFHLGGKAKEKPPGF